MAAAFKAPAVRMEATYRTPTETHNPMEPHATIAVWDDPEHLTLYDANQGVFFMRQFLSMLLAMPQDNMRVISPFVGGAFGLLRATGTIDAGVDRLLHVTAGNVHLLSAGLIALLAVVVGLLATSSRLRGRSPRAVPSAAGLTPPACGSTSSAL